MERQRYFHSRGHHIGWLQRYFLVPSIISSSVASTWCDRNGIMFLFLKFLIHKNNHLAFTQLFRVSFTGPNLGPFRTSWYLTSCQLESTFHLSHSILGSAMTVLFFEDPDLFSLLSIVIHSVDTNACFLSYYLKKSIWHEWLYSKFLWLIKLCYHIRHILS